jgi:hypothetical protein
MFLKTSNLARKMQKSTKNGGAGYEGGGPLPHGSVTSHIHTAIGQSVGAGSDWARSEDARSNQRQATRRT